MVLKSLVQTWLTACIGSSQSYMRFLLSRPSFHGVIALQVCVPIFFQNIFSLLIFPVKRRHCPFPISPLLYVRSVLRVLDLSVWMILIFTVTISYKAPKDTLTWQCTSTRPWALSREAVLMFSYLYSKYSLHSILMLHNKKKCSGDTLNKMITEEMTTYSSMWRNTWIYEWRDGEGGREEWVMTESQTSYSHIWIRNSDVWSHNGIPIENIKNMYFFCKKLREMILSALRYRNDKYLKRQMLPSLDIVAEQGAHALWEGAGEWGTPCVS